MPFLFALMHCEVPVEFQGAHVWNSVFLLPSVPTLISIQIKGPCYIGIIDISYIEGLVIQHDDTNRLSFPCSPSFLHNAMCCFPFLLGMMLTITGLVNENLLYVHV